jgi:acetolactate synthase small subunit
MHKITRHRISCMVNDHPGVLVNLAASFAEKGVNITTIDAGEPD